MAGGRIAAVLMYRLHNLGRNTQRQSAATVFFRDQTGKQAGIGQCLHKLGRVFLMTVLIAPVFTGEVRRDTRD